MGPGYVGKNPDQQPAQEWLFGFVVFLVQFAAVEGPPPARQGVKRPEILGSHSGQHFPHSRLLWQFAAMAGVDVIPAAQQEPHGE